MACRLPGADGLDAYWELLRRGGYAVERMPDAKLDRKLYYCADRGHRGKTYSDIGGFVSEREIDWSLLNITADDADAWDACHLNFCEVAAQACADAGYDPRNLPIRNTGVYVGHSGGTGLGGELAYGELLDEFVSLLSNVTSVPQVRQPAFQKLLAEELKRSRPRRYNGRPWVDAAFAAGLVSRCLGLHGPHCSIDAACASSLVALALAGLSLQSGQTDMAIVGGASFNKTDSLILFSHAQSCSANGSRPFDEAADGLVSSEGYVALVVKTLARARRDGDRIQALIRGIGLATDGRGKSLWAPRREGQYAAIERAYSNEVSASEVQLIEAHATSTHLGDATEVEALATFFGRLVPAGKRLPLGSVKSNIGHTLETAGLAGVVKSILAMRHGVVPASINVRQPSQSIRWSEIPLAIAEQSQPWPKSTAPRRAAVNAFGIGGLNVHVVLDEPRAADAVPPTAPSSEPQAFEPIAVIGRGLVVPGASDVAAFEKLLRTAQRTTELPPGPRRIEGFQYDWRKHKIPPKQIAQANPLQFMLLEAAEQALREAGLLERQFDRRHTAVVVGSPFGGDFGNELFAGLRLPEFRRSLIALLHAQGATAGEAEAAADEYEERFLKNYPALLDETGSFTSSTLASRLSKTFDLMGGAMALDAGDASSFAALNAACQLLHSGTVSYVLCAAAQRATDASAQENRRQQYRGLLESGQTVESTGEGVVLLVLKPLTAAERDGDRVLATIDGIGVGFNSGSLSRSIAAAAAQLPESLQQRHACFGSDGTPHLAAAIAKPLPSLTSSPNVPLTGYLQAAQGLLDVVTASCRDLVDSPAERLLAARGLGGQSYLVAVSAGTVPLARQTPLSKDQSVPIDSKTRSTIQLSKDQQRAPNQPLKVVHFAEASLGDLQLALARAARPGTSPPPVSKLTVPRTNSSSVTPSAWRAAIVSSESELSAQATKLSSLLGQEQAIHVAADQGLFWSAPQDWRSLQPNHPPGSTQRPLKIAWLFPGQGSQYPGMLRDLIHRDPRAAAALAEANTALASIGEPSFEELTNVASDQLGQDIWHTQAAMLIADWIMLAAMPLAGPATVQNHIPYPLPVAGPATVQNSLVLGPDVVSGHSFGEFAALLAAGCWDLPTALRATRLRCQAVERFALPDHCLLSIAADARTVAQVLMTSELPVAISHRNAETQTVVGGPRAAIARLSQLLSNDAPNRPRIATQALAVPTAFHTDCLRAAVEPFRKSLREIAIAPPRLPLLSSVNNRFLAEPDEIRDNLAAQLVTPLDFVGLVQRLVDSGVTHVLEVGPQQVLTRLIRQSGAPLFVLPTDNPRKGTAFQLHCVSAAFSLFAGSPLSVCEPVEFRAVPAAAIHFDATQVRKQRQRLAAQQAVKLSPSSKPPPIPVHFDATAPRPSASPSVPRSRTGLGADESHCQESASHRLSDQGMEGTEESLHPQFAESTGPKQTELETFLIEFVVEQTGYPAEMIDLDWDMEADLGIDSIKKAQLFGELREFFDIESHRGLKLDDYRTLRSIAELLARTPGKGQWLSPHQPGLQSLVAAADNQTVGGSLPSKVDAAPEHILKPSQPDRSLPSQENAIDAIKYPNQPDNETSEADVAAVLIDFVVEQTGYPAEIIELDADLEADLGIDSIKQAQLLGELREMFSLDMAAMLAAGNAEAGGQTPQMRTLRDITQFVLAAQAKHATTFSASQTPAVAGPATVQNQVSPEIVANPSPLNRGRSSYDSGQTSYDSSQTSSDSSRFVDDSSRSGSEIASLPRWDGSADSEISHELTARLHRNLRSMAQRSRIDGPSPTSLSPQASTNGVEALRRAQVDALARACGVYRGGLDALDQLLRTQLQIRPTIDWQSPKSAGDARRGPTPRWFATIQLPNWLSTSSVAEPTTLLRASHSARRASSVAGPATVQNTAAQGVQTLHLAGCTLPLVFLRQTLCVLIGPLSDSSAPTERTAELARRAAELMESLAENTIEATLQQAADWQLDQDWWLVVADCNRPQQIGWIAARGPQAACELVAAEALPSAAEDPPSVGEIKVGFDPAEQYFVVASVGAIEILKPTSAEPAGGPAPSTTAGIASRYVLRMVPAPQRSAPGRQPVWAGAALVVGDNPPARQLEARLRGAGVETYRLIGSEDPRLLAEQFARLAAATPLPHLFLLSACDADARVSLDDKAWQSRRNRGLMSNFWLCQRWLRHITESGLADVASLIAVSSLGGDFGFSGNLHSVEGGGLNGLLKSILIESWMQGHRSLPIKTLDTSAAQSPSEIVDHIWRELALPSYDNEISYIDGLRHVVRAVARPLPLPAATAPSDLPLTRGGNWICTGGGRGITAFVAEKLALRYGLQLHLLGTAPVPEANLLERLAPTDAAAWQALSKTEKPIDHNNQIFAVDEDARRTLKLSVMSAARNAGQSPIRAWQDMEKSLEIAATLRRLSGLGIAAQYHSCDVADRDALAQVLERVRCQSGPIHGVLHGAGVGQDARFERKQPEKVHQCIAAKVDGALALMAATRHDPLEYFIGFGSISGRFGANGHADYSLANEMLCKQMNWLRAERPEVKAIGFHWHAWGDVGMATKPETRLALEMIDMQFMPAQEGFQHLVAEIESGTGESEVLITDQRYYRMFYPAETIVSDKLRPGSVPPPLLTSAPSAQSTTLKRHFVADVDPCKDPFLTEHLLDGRPLLPFVIACEMLAEAGMAHLDATRVRLCHVTAHAGVRFFRDAPRTLRISSTEVAPNAAACELRSDFVARDGRVVDGDRLNFSASVEAMSESDSHTAANWVRLALPAGTTWQPAIYPAVDEKFYVGFALRRLKQVALVDGGVVGRISAPALIELAGGGRDVRGWQLPSAAMDACLFALGMLAWRQLAPGAALPVRMGQLTSGRLPSPGEALEVHGRCTAAEPNSAKFDFTLYGVDGQMILHAVDYQIAWLASNPAPATHGDSETGTAEHRRG